MKPRNMIATVEATAARRQQYNWKEIKKKTVNREPKNIQEDHHGEVTPLNK